MNTPNASLTLNEALSSGNFNAILVLVLMLVEEKVLPLSRVTAHLKRAVAATDDMPQKFVLERILLRLSELSDTGKQPD
jgi:hypothetical protein